VFKFIQSYVNSNLHVSTNAAPVSIFLLQIYLIKYTLYCMINGLSIYPMNSHQSVFTVALNVGDAKLNYYITGFWNWGQGAFVYICYIVKQPFCLFVYDNCCLCVCLIHPFFFYFVAFDPILGVSCANKELYFWLGWSMFVLLWYHPVRTVPKILSENRRQRRQNRYISCILISVKKIFPNTKFDRLLY
jgi:hypothetical protein